jgi:hypothetical protein
MNYEFYRRKIDIAFLICLSFSRIHLLGLAYGFEDACVQSDARIPA